MSQLKYVGTAVAAVLLAVLIAGCERSVIKFTIVSQNGETHFAVPVKMIDKCCRPDAKKANLVMVDLDAKSNGGKDDYFVTLLANGNNNSLVTKTMPDRVTAAEEVTSEFPSYKKYIQHKDPQMPFLLVGKDKSGKTIYLQCAKQTNAYKKCTYYGIFDGKLSYEFMFPATQINDIENLIIYAQTQINQLIVAE
jgi:hypothetical protein